MWVLPEKKINFPNKSLEKTYKHIIKPFTELNTLAETEGSEIPLPPNPVTGVPFKEDITDDRIGSIRLTTASSGFE